MHGREHPISLRFFEVPVNERLLNNRGDVGAGMVQPKRIKSDGLIDTGLPQELHLGNDLAIAGVGHYAKRAVIAVLSAEDNEFREYAVAAIQLVIDSMRIDVSGSGESRDTAVFVCAAANECANNVRYIRLLKRLESCTICHEVHNEGDCSTDSK